MNILLAPNNYYVMPTMVLLQSLFETAQEQLDIYVLHSGLLPENIQKLDDFVTGHGGRFHPIALGETVFDKAHTSIHITKEAYYRLLATRSIIAKRELSSQKILSSSTISFADFLK